MSNLPVQFLSVRDAARLLKVSEKTLRRWEDRGYITPLRTTGKHRRYSVDLVKEFKKNKNRIKKEVEIAKVPEFAIHAIKGSVVTNRLTVLDKSESSEKEIQESSSDTRHYVIDEVKIAPNYVSFARKAFVSYIAVVLILLGGYGIASLTLPQKLNTQAEPQAVTQGQEANLGQVLAATNFRNAQFNVNIPAVFNSSLTLGGDAFSDLTGDGLLVTDSILNTVLGTDITSSEIVDSTISETDLLLSNTASGAQFLSYNTTTGGFTWATPIDTTGSNFFTDSGDITYLTSTTDDFALGGTGTSSPFFFDTENRNINLTRTSAGKWINFTDGTDIWGLYNRAGTPEGFITANTGTLSMDTLNGILYVKTDDGDNTGWNNLATGTSSPWTETAGLVTLGTTTSNVNVGGSTNLGKLAIDGDTDEIQLLVQGNGTQTADLVVFENSAGVNLLSLSNTAGLTLGSNGTDGSLTIYSEQGGTDFSTIFQPGTQTENITYTLPNDNGGADNYVLTTDGSGVLAWESVAGAGGFTSFTLSGDSGTDQTISDSNILEIAGGTNGIDTVGTATDTVTLNLDTTEIGTTTFGSGSGITWTFDAGATDPTIAFSSGSISIGGSQVTIDTTNGNFVSAGDLAVNGGDITSSGDLTLTLTGGDLFLANTNTINIGGNGNDVAYNAIGDTTSGASSNVDSDDDLYVEGNVEVDGSLYAGGVDISTFVCPDCIDFDDMEDTLDLDAALTLNQGSLTWTQNFTGTTTTGLTYNANSLTTGSAINITTSSNPASVGPVSVNQINATSTNATTATTLAVLDIGFTNNPSVAGNTEYIVQIQNELTSNTTDNAVTGVLRIDNADTSTAGSTVATNGLLITNSGDIAGGIVNAINIDDTDITTDIVLQNDETISNDSDGIVLITSPSTSLSGDLTVQGGDITLNTAGTIVPSAAGTITVGSANLQSLTVTTDGTGDAEVVLPTGSISGTEILDSTISEVDLNATNSPTSAFILSYDIGGGFTWISNTGGTGASKFTDSGSLTYLTDSTDSITIGSSTELAKLAIDGDANEIQLVVQGNATQTAGLVTVENSVGTDFFVIEDLGGLSISPSSTDDVTIVTDADSTVVITGLSSGSGTAVCLDGSNNMVTCSAGSSSATLQSAYDADTNGSDTLITLSTSDDSIIFRNPASSGTDSAFNFQVDNLATGITTNNFKNLNITEAGSFNTTSTSLTNYAGYISNTSTESAGANVLTNVGLYVTSSGGDTNYSGIFEAGNFGIGDTSPASLFTVGATDAFQINSTGNIVAIGGAAHAISNSSGNLTIIPATSGNTTLGSTNTTSGTTIQSGTGDIIFASQDDFIFTPIDGSEIDITAVASTTLDGVIDLNVDSSVTGGFEVISQGLTVNNGATGGDDFTSELVTLTANDADADLFGIQINTVATLNASGGSYEALIRLDNAENTIATVTDGILITSSSSTDQDITDAIDVSHTNIVNAINVGANIVLGTTGDINLSNFDVTGSSGDITTAGDIAINGGDITATGDLTVTPAGGDIFFANAVTLNLGGNATDVAYNIIGDSTAGASGSMTSDDDLYIEGFLEADSGTILSPDSTNDISIVTDSDSTLNVTGLSAGTGNALCLDGSSNVVTCTVGSGGISGTGTAGQVAFFDSSSNITSETSGFGWDSTNNLFTLTAGTGNTTQTAQTISSTAQGLTSGGLINANLVNTSVTASFTGDILGVSSNRDNDTALQTLTDTGNLVEFGRTTTTNNASAVTNVTGAVLNITNTVTATAGTIADSANLISITQDADATGALLYLNTNRSSTGTALLIEQSSGGTDILQVQDNGNLTMLGDLAITGGDITGANSETIDIGETDNGSFIFTAAGETNNESLELDLETTANAASLFSSTGVVTVDLGSSIYLTNIGNAGTDFTSTGGLTLDDILTVNDDLDVVLAAGENISITDSAAATADILSLIADANTTSDGIDGIFIDFRTGNGTNPTNNAINIDLTSGGGAGDTLVGLDLALSGTGGTEYGINFSDNNFDTDINATTDLTLGIGGTNEITLTGTNLAPSTAEGNSLGSATLEWEQLFVGDDNGIAFGLDQDWTLVYDEATDDRLELTTSGTTGALIQSAATTGTALNVIDNAITTGTVLQVESTATSLTTAGDGFLGYFNWNPGSTTTASGDLFRINIGTNGNVTNVFNVTDNGSSLFSVSETQITSALPHSFTAAGDVNIAYDLIFTNQTASTIDSYGPLTIRAGESFESNNLTLTSYLSGNILLNTGATAGKVGIGAGITPASLLHVSATGSNPLNKALVTFDQDESQDILTASASGVTKFVLDNSGKIYLGALDVETANTTATCWFNNTINGQTLKEITDCNGTPTDLAENFGTNDPSIEAGDIVISSGQAETVSPKGLITSKAFINKSDTVYQDNILGVVSTAPNQVYGEDGLFDSSENPRPVSLTGRVPTKVSAKNGNITTGDFVTSSDIPGVAMKATSAGVVIGQALEDFNPQNLEEIGKIIVFVNVGYKNPEPEITRGQIEEMLREAEQNQDLLNQSNEWEELIVSDLYVTNTATFNSLSLSQSLVVGSDLVIQNNNIDTLTNPLNIQGSGTQPINFMAGKVTIDTSGNMVITGDLKVLGTVDAGKVTVSNQVAGASVIPAGYFEITILNENIKPDSLIFVTPTSSIKYNIYVKSQTEVQAVVGFDEPEVPTEIDTKFNWWIVGVSQ